MATSNNTDRLDTDRLIEAIHALEIRINRIEAYIGRENLPISKSTAELGYSEQEEESIPSLPSGISIESRIVEQGLGWLGTGGFLIGIIFLTNYTYRSGHNFLSEFIGYFAAGCIFVLAYFLRKLSPHLVSLLRSSGFLLIYYITLRLHFFTTSPLILYKPLAFIFLLLVVSAILYYAVRRQSELLGLVAVVLGLLSALFYNSTHITLLAIAAFAAISLYLLYQYSWWRLFIAGMFLVYFSHIIWYLNNPLIGQPMHAVDSHQYNLVYLFVYAAIYVSSILLARKNNISDAVLVSIAIINALLFSGVLALVLAKFFPENYVWIFLIITMLCIAFSVYLKSKTVRLFAPAFYACCGFMAASISIYGNFGLPDSYLYLVLLSLVVVSMALWFRSRIIVVVNALLFVIILMGYLAASDPVGIIDLAFAVVALASARILNWKKDRLTLQTEFMRNSYLLIGFIMVLTGLYRALPSHYVTLAWTGAAIIYFVLSIALKNVKYRWMAIATIIATGFHLLLADLASLEIGYRVIAFLFFAVISIGVSLYYTHRIKNRTEP